MTETIGNLDATSISNPNIFKPKALELIGGLYQQNPKLFWFLNKTNPEDIQAKCEEHDGLTFGKINGLPVVVDVVSGTLASDPTNKPNEDSYLNIDIGDGRHLFAVIDGASSQAPIAGLAQYGISGAFYVSHLISCGFRESECYKELCIRTELKAKDIMLAVNDWIRNEMQKVDGVDYNNVLTIPGAAATFALLDFKNDQLSLAHVADTIEIDDYDAYLTSDPSATKINTGNRNATFDQATLALATQISQESNITLVEAAKDPRVKQQLKDSYTSKINTPNGVGILNGMPQLATNDLIEEMTMDLRPVAKKYQAEHKNLVADILGNLPAEGQVIRVGVACDGFWSAFPDGEGTDPNRILYSMESLKATNVVHNFFTESDTKQKIVPRLKPVDDITSTYIRLTFNGGLDMDACKIEPEVQGQAWENPSEISNAVPLPVGKVGQFGSTRRLNRELNGEYTESGGTTASPI